MFDRKAAIMNAATERLEYEAGEIVPTPFCFGGNMIFTAEMAAEVCFDPAITRGEDIDYLINARLAGRWFFMNKSLRILHLPPSGGSYKDVAYHKVVQDVLRFMYEREKLRAWREIGAKQEVTEAELEPYPGLCLGDDLEASCQEVIQRIIDATDASTRANLGLSDSTGEFIRQSQAKAEAGVEAYRSSQDAWGQLVESVRSNPGVSELLGHRIDRPAKGTRA